ncbi:receptor tyrosine-protein kinase erbB-2-like [Polyodon spathula]|uniref:receptor tyrosine-protein kinase erbB-2-like n=1 Tax=Polyodon spathula TaxID=7913 RepID=UPI001B7EB2BB|nr:receptor tyrosine-protein kinase erbB-2-like [Polyodon spathula]
MEFARSLVLIVTFLTGIAGARGREVCTGTLMKLALPSNLQNQYEILKKLYTGCQVVQGNLEITHLQGALDLDFLKGITEVQGYVLIADTAVDFIPLENLRIIRGTQLYQDTFALAVLNNRGLQELRMKSLTSFRGWDPSLPSSPTPPSHHHSLGVPPIPSPRGRGDR